MGNRVEAVIFDFGGTLDTGGDHWGRVIHDAYEAEGLEIDTDLFKEAYVYGERELAKPGIIGPSTSFHDLLRLKIAFQTEYLLRIGEMRVDPRTALSIAERCFEVARRHTRESGRLLATIPADVRKAVVSNFYGNLRHVLGEFGLIEHFDVVVDSAEVGIRKPDPAIFSLALARLGNPEPERVWVVGDSMKNDIVPAQKLGMKAVLLKGRPWFGNTSEMRDVRTCESLKTAISLFNLH